MNNVIGKTCPYCQFPIKPGDDYVICSDCKQPHHENCWKDNGGCTTFGCKGKAEVEGASPIEPVVTTCPQCRQANAADAVFCAECGTNMQLPRAMQQGVIQSGIYQALPITGAYPKASIFKRLGAHIIDTIVAFPVATAGMTLVMLKVQPLGNILWFVGMIWQTYYMFIKDGRGRGQSIGKAAAGLMVVHLTDNTPCSKSQSAIRYSVMSIGIVYSLIHGPGLGAPDGLQLLIFLSGLISLVECCMVLFSPSGRRFGDRLANTQVIDAVHYQLRGNRR